jgi:hypothetical protein
VTRPDEFDDGPTPTAWVAASSGAALLTLCDVGLARVHGIASTRPPCGSPRCTCAALEGETFRSANDVEARAAYDVDAPGGKGQPS